MQARRGSVAAAVARGAVVVVGGGEESLGTRTLDAPDTPTGGRTLRCRRRTRGWLPGAPSSAGCLALVPEQVARCLCQQPADPTSVQRRPVPGCRRLNISPDATACPGRDCAGAPHNPSSSTGFAARIRRLPRSGVPSSRVEASPQRRRWPQLGPPLGRKSTGFVWPLSMGFRARVRQGVRFGVTATSA